MTVAVVVVVVVAEIPLVVATVLQIAETPAGVTLYINPVPVLVQVVRELVIVVAKPLVIAHQHRLARLMAVPVVQHNVTTDVLPVRGPVLEVVEEIAALHGV